MNEKKFFSEDKGSHRGRVSGHRYTMSYMPAMALSSMLLSIWPDPRKQAETPCCASCKHWSCIRLMRGETTTTTFPVIKAGSWKHNDLPTC